MSTHNISFCGEIRRNINTFLSAASHPTKLCTRSRRPSLFVCVKVLRPSQPSGVMSSAVSLPNHTFTGQT